MTPEELVRLAEEEASCEVFGLLKRPDEKVGDRARLRQPEVRRGPGARHRLRLMREPRIAQWTVKSENFESIHNHSAYAEISGDNA
jgi:GTP cyclohydrolase I